MKKVAGLVLLVCGLVISPYLSFAETYYADIIITPSAYSGFFSGFLGGDGNPGPNSIDWGIGNSAPFSGLTNDMVFSICSGDFMTGSNWKERMRITKDGNVGIGTTSPSYTLAINGTVGCKELTVTNTGWADFVFEDTYQLPPLHEIEEFISENKHLPGIPTEAEVKELGVNVGNISSKLLQKIEELTLYMIDLKKDITALKKENESLKSQQASIQQELIHFGAE